MLLSPGAAAIACMPAHLPTQSPAAAPLPLPFPAFVCCSAAADGVLAQDVAQARQIWHLREGITEGLRHRGACAHAHTRSHQSA